MKIKFPVVSGSQTTADPCICTTCHKTMESEGACWIMLGARGAGSQELKGFCSLTCHSDKHDSVTVDVVIKSSNGQADIGFCSKECLQKFFTACVNAL